MDRERLDKHLEELLRKAPNDDPDRDVAAKYAPVLYFDENEPFLPIVAGYTIFRQDGQSPSFPRMVQLKEPGMPQALLAIEYAIWWDWDIGHLYELEHVWVFVGAEGSVIRVDGSWHGGYHTAVGEAISRDKQGRIVLFPQPGKHAMAFSLQEFQHLRGRGDVECRNLAGAGGVWETPLFRGKLPKHPLPDQLVRTYLKEKSFQPSWKFTRPFLISREMLIPWPLLERWIPERVALWVSELKRMFPPAKRRVLCIGHRGASAYKPENTLAAFNLAADMGADMVELDVHLSKDGKPVVIHDASLERLTEGTGLIKDHSWKELQHLHVNGQESIASLEEVLAWAKARSVGLYIELKGPGTDRAVANLIKRYQMQRYVIVGSFDRELVAGVKAAAPDIYTSIMFHELDVDPVSLAKEVHADFVHPCWEWAGDRPDKYLTSEWIKRVHDANLGIITWHEEGPAVVAALKKLGVEGICSNRPDLVVRSAPGSGDKHVREGT